MSSIILSEIFTTYFQSPVGNLKISGTAFSVTEILFWHSHETVSSDLDDHQKMPEVILQCVAELSAYFKGSRRAFDVIVHQEGTEFQKRVWNELTRIPYGKTISYLELAKRLGDVKSIRAAASTNGKNKISIIVPCHRVIGSNYSLVGYAGGLSNKRWLLEHEAKMAHGVQTLF